MLYRYIFLSILYLATLLVPEDAFASPEYRFFQIDTATVNQWTDSAWSLKITHSDPLEMSDLASQWRGVWSWNSPSEMESDVFRTYPSAYLPSVCTSSTSLCGLGGYSTTSPWTLYQTSGTSAFDDVSQIRAYLYFCDSNGSSAGGNCGSEADIRNSDLVYWTSVLWTYGSTTGIPDGDTTNDPSYISSFNPALGSTTASTTVYFSVEGFNSGEYEEVAFEYIGDSPNTISGLLSFDLNDGYYSVSGSSYLPAGQYWGWVKMYDTDGVFPSVIEDLKFRVATTNPDTIFGFGAQVFTPTATSAPLLPDCLWYMFDLGKCLYQLAIPSGVQFVSLIGQATSGLFARVPFGYATRILSILSGDVGTSSLPSVVLTVPERLPGGGSTLDLTPWQHLGTSSKLQTAVDSNGDTLWDIVEVGWNSLCILIFTLWLFGVILNESKHH